MMGPKERRHLKTGTILNDVYEKQIPP